MVSLLGGNRFFFETTVHSHIYRCWKLLHMEGCIYLLLKIHGGEGDEDDDEQRRGALAFSRGTKTFGHVKALFPPSILSQLQCSISKVL